MLFTCIAGVFTVMNKKATIVIYLVLQSTPTYIPSLASKREHVQAYSGTLSRRNFWQLCAI